MEKENYKSIKNKLDRIIVKILITLFLSFCFYIQFSFSTDWIEVWPYEIKFNYEPGNSNDAINIRKDVDDDITVPEWKYGVRSEKFAYIKNQSDRKIQVRFDSDCDSMHLLINLSVYSGTGIGEVCNLFIANYDKLDWITLTLEGSVLSSVGIGNFTWEWEIYAIPKNPAYCSDMTDFNTYHSYYTLLATPQDPMAEPWTDVLDYACDWASGNTDADNACTDILTNGFSAHYTWNDNCHRLSSDFVRLVSSLGISASQHYWGKKAQNIGDMYGLKTTSIDPVGPTFGSGIYTWNYHQWAATTSYQRDPSTATSKYGNWGSYEDELFYQYYERMDAYYYQWVANQTGQIYDCEAPTHRIYDDEPFLYDWLGPNR